MKQTKHIVLALDLARTAGFAIGRPGGRPRSGTIQFASDGSSHEAAFHAAALWAEKIIVAYQPTTIVWEAPLASSFVRGRTNADTTSLLFGFPAVIGATAFRLGFYDLRKATPAEVRVHFIGSNMKSKDAERETKARCRVLGWPFKDDNEADALALWSYMSALLVPDCGPAPALPGILRPAKLRGGHSAPPPLDAEHGPARSAAKR